MKRIAVIDRELCRPDKCYLVCKKVCPKVRSGEECIVMKDGKVYIDENICIGCGLCIKACEKAGFKAISIVNLPEALKETPVHRFGPNDFVLFRLPFPSSGEVVGLVGPNGVGKTTALRILSGELKPNLANFDRELDFSELIKMFRGTELQSYLEKLEREDIRTSYKPQRVDQIPRFYKGRVSKFLQKVDERKILNDLLSVFGLEEVMEKEINKISGGELQRVAIMACVAKDADVYYLDEPTSFLDVFQRLSIAKAIRQYCKNKAVMVVDHDLATLDFLADKVHIFYGVPSVYGIVSKPYAVRVGINTFLDGYIREDNVRIRSEPITFFASMAEKTVSPEILISFKEIEKKFKGFRIEVKSGDIRKKEVLVVLGANALGKTTFAKILAGEIKDFKGEISCKIKISYKPQCIELPKGTVREVLSNVADIEKEEYKTEIIRPLGLNKLLEKNIEDLSGGEIQRVAIASCLSKQADLYLLDEPSAFLDVEQRLTVAKMLNKISETKEKSAMVIDHDLLFLSQLGSRAMLFLGRPGKHGYTDCVDFVKNSFNRFLKEVNVTFRADVATGRPRANKPESKLDRLQKEEGDYFKI